MHGVILWLMFLTLLNQILSFDLQWSVSISDSVSFGTLGQRTNLLQGRLFRVANAIRIIGVFTQQQAVSGPIKHRADI